MGETAKKTAEQKATVVENSVKQAVDTMTKSMKDEVKKEVKGLKEDVLKDIKTQSPLTETEWSEFKKKHDLLQTFVYVLLGVVGFLVFLLLIAVAYTCTQAEPAKERPNRQQRRVAFRQQKNNGWRQDPRFEQRFVSATHKQGSPTA